MRTVHQASSGTSARGDPWLGGRVGCSRLFWVVACVVHTVCAQSVVPLEDMQLVQLSIPNCTGLEAEAVRTPNLGESFPIRRYVGSHGKAGSPLGGYRRIAYPWVTRSTGCSGLGHLHGVPLSLHVNA